MYKMINSMLFNAKSYVPAPRRKPIPCAVELDLEGGVAVRDKTRLYASTKFGLKAQGPWRPAAPGSRGVGRLGRAGRPAIQLTRSMPPLASKVETRPHSTAKR
jgi:hypothetical protein